MKLLLSPPLPTAAARSFHFETLFDVCTTCAGENPAHFWRARRARRKLGKNSARTACAEKTRQEFGAHGVRGENSARIRRAWHARRKLGKNSARMACAEKTRQEFGAHGVRGEKLGKNSARMACAEKNSARIRRARRAPGKKQMKVAPPLIGNRE